MTFGRPHTRGVVAVVQLIVTTLHGEFPAFGEPGRRFKMSGGQLLPG